MGFEEADFHELSCSVAGRLFIVQQFGTLQCDYRWQGCSLSLRELYIPNKNMFRLMIFYDVQFEAIAVVLPAIPNEGEQIPIPVRWSARVSDCC